MPFPDRFGPTSRNIFCSVGRAREDVAEPLGERVLRLLVVAPQLVEEPQPAFRLRRARVVREREHVRRRKLRRVRASSRVAKSRIPFASGTISPALIGVVRRPSSQTGGCTRLGDVADRLQRLEDVRDLVLRRLERDELRRLALLDGLPVLRVLEPSPQLRGDAALVVLGPVVAGVAVEVLRWWRRRSVPPIAMYVSATNARATAIGSVGDGTILSATKGMSGANSTSGSSSKPGSSPSSVQSGSVLVTCPLVVGITRWISAMSGSSRGPGASKRSAPGGREVAHDARASTRQPSRNASMSDARNRTGPVLASHSA